MKPHHVLFAIGYPVAIAGIIRLRQMLRDRDVRWFALEEAGTVAIVAGWALRGGRPLAVALNAAWGLGLAVYFVSVSRRPQP